MINMAEKYHGLIAQIKNEGEKNIMSELFKTFSIEVVADLLHKDVQEIQNIINK